MNYKCNKKSNSKEKDDKTYKDIEKYLVKKYGKHTKLSPSLISKEINYFIEHKIGGRFGLGFLTKIKNNFQRIFKRKDHKIYPSNYINPKTYPMVNHIETYTNDPKVLANRNTEDYTWVPHNRTLYDNQSTITDFYPAKKLNITLYNNRTEENFIELKNRIKEAIIYDQNMGNNKINTLINTNIDPQKNLKFTWNILKKSDLIYNETNYNNVVDLYKFLYTENLVPKRGGKPKFKPHSINVIKKSKTKPKTKVTKRTSKNTK